MMSYVIPDVNREQLMSAAVDIEGLTIEDKGNHFTLQIPADPQFSLKKRMKLSQLSGIPGDDIQSNAKTFWVMVDKTATDPENTWLFANAVSVGHPEKVIELLLDRLRELDLDTVCYTEHDQEYWDFLDCPDDGLDIEEQEE